MIIFGGRCLIWFRSRYLLLRLYVKINVSKVGSLVCSIPLMGESRAK